MPVRISLFFLSLLPVVAQSGGLGSSSFYDGPAILGRGGYGVGVKGRDRMPLRFQVSANGTYDSNILGYSLNPDGEFRDRDAFGYSIMAGANGQYQWKRSYVGVNYAGDYQHLSGSSFYNGSNHRLNVGYGNRVARQWELSSRLAAGTSNRFLNNYGGYGVAASEFELQTVPMDELFDSRMYYIGNETSATYIKSSRNSVRFLGMVNSIRRKAPGLSDMQTYGAGSDWVYRLDRRSSVGVSYLFGHYDFTKQFGESDIHTLGVHYSKALGRFGEIRLSLMGLQQSTVGVREFALDPILAAILGRPTGREVFESNNLLYGFNGSIGKTLARSSFSVRAGRGIMPGNGFFMTSINEYVGGTASYTLHRKVNLGGDVSYSRMSSLGFASGSFRGWMTGGGISYHLFRNLGVNGRFSWRTNDLQQSNYARSGFRATVGITYSPGDGVYSLW